MDRKTGTMPHATTETIHEARPPVADAARPDFVLARFRSSARLDDALHRLATAGFGREDLALPDLDPPIERHTPELASKAADDDTEAQQSRLFHSSVGGSFAAMMAATAVAATGGAAAAVAGVALGVGAAVAGVTHLFSRALSHSEQQDRDRKAAAGRLLLAVRTPTEAQRTRAATILREIGAELF
ncbi:MAG TPA: hypothetical protein VFA03_00455 [Acetobacteraceae bacterium]|nr:hypothetical protein [Acetobacteraceae bacterium]